MKDFKVGDKVLCQHSGSLAEAVVSSGKQEHEGETGYWVVLSNHKNKRVFKSMLLEMEE